MIEDRVIENIDALNLNESSEKDNCEPEKINTFVDDETINSSEWKEKKKHIFILSSAGKPVYSR